MNNKTKKIIAREWLYFVISLLVGFLHLVLRANLNDHFSVKGFRGFILFLLIPYILFQFIRSLIWSAKTLKSKSN